MAAWRTTGWLLAALAATSAACGGGGDHPDAAPSDAPRVDAPSDAVPSVDVPGDQGALDAGGDDVVTSDAVDTGFAGEAAAPDAPVGMDAMNDDAPAADAARDVERVDVPFVDGGACGPLVDLSTAGTVTGATTRFVGDTTGSPATAAIAASCGASDHEVILAYTMHNAGTLTVSVANPGTPVTFDTVLAVRTACAPGTGSELACDDDTLPDRRSNATTPVLAAGQTVYIVLGGSTTAGSRYVDQGAFELTATENMIGGPCDPSAAPGACGAGFECTGTGTTGVCRGYVESALASPAWVDACATGTRQTLTDRDDGHTPTLALPFAFTYFGTAYTHATADTNGYVVLGSGTPGNSYGNTLPIGDGPAVSAFHDDLVVNSSPGGDVCTLAVGSGATAQYVIEWTGTTRYNHGSVSLQFEVVLSNTTNTIDFVYNALSATAPGDAMYATGANAAIGLEGNDGATVLQHAGTVAAHTGLRFTPRP